MPKPSENSFARIDPHDAMFLLTERATVRFNTGEVDIPVGPSRVEGARDVEIAGALSKIERSCDVVGGESAYLYVFNEMDLGDLPCAYDAASIFVWSNPDYPWGSVACGWDIRQPSGATTLLGHIPRDKDGYGLAFETPFETPEPRFVSEATSGDTLSLTVAKKGATRAEVLTVSVRVDQKIPPDEVDDAADFGEMPVIIAEDRSGRLVANPDHEVLVLFSGSLLAVRPRDDLALPRTQTGAVDSEGIYTVQDAAVGDDRDGAETNGSEPDAC